MHIVRAATRSLLVSSEARLVCRTVDLAVARQTWGSNCSEACTILNMIKDRKITELKTRFYCSCRLAGYVNRYEGNQVTEHILDYFPVIQ